MALLAVLVLATVFVCLLLPKTETSSTGPDHGNLANGTAQLDSSSFKDSATGMSNKGSSNADDSSGDFSGIKSTLDPAVAAANSSVAHPTPEPQQTPIASLPLVFQKVDPQRLAISPDQQKIIYGIQQKFTDMIGGANQDPSDPLYLQRWQQALPLINEELEVQLGQEFYIQYETAAAQAAAARGNGSRQSNWLPR